MNVDQLHEIAKERIPTAQEFLAFIRGQGWDVVIKADGTASLRTKEKGDPVAFATAKMLGREPWRTNVLELLKPKPAEPKRYANDDRPHSERQPEPPTQPVQQPAPPEPVTSDREQVTRCEVCRSTWYCSEEEVREQVQSPHFCGHPDKPGKQVTNNQGEPVIPLQPCPFKQKVQNNGAKTGTE